MRWFNYFQERRQFAFDKTTTKNFVTVQNAEQELLFLLETMLSESYRSYLT